MTRETAAASAAPGTALVIVTGATGIVGQATLAALQAAGLPALGLDHGASGEGLEAVLASRPAAERERAVLIHLAGPSDARAAEAHPAAAVQEIVALTHHTLELCLRFRLAKCVLVSTAAVYGPQPQQPVTEAAVPQPRGAYAGAKAACECLAMGRGAGEGLAVDIARPANVIAARRKPGTLLDDLLRRLRRGDNPVEVQRLGVRRDYVHVSDVARALALLAAQPAARGAVRRFNVGTGRGTTPEALCAALAEALGMTAPSVAQAGPGDARAFDLVLDASALRAATGWRPQVSLAEALREMAHAG